MMVTYQLEAALNDTELKVLNDVLYGYGFGMDETDFDLQSINDESLRDMVEAYIRARLSYDLNDSYDEQDARRAAMAKRQRLGELIRQFIDTRSVAQSFE